MESLTELLQEQMKDLYHAEKQLTKALPAMAKKASNQSLKEAFTNHVEQTNNHVRRLEEAGESLGFSLKGKVCRAMEGLIAEGKEAIAEKGDKFVTDAALIAAAQRVEHYEISAYGTARALAEHLECTDVAELLQATLDEEAAADEKLTSISLEEILPEAPMGNDEEEEEVEEEEEEQEEETVTAGAASRRR
jgi:ferritin-like metal-binding protein YciE